MCGGRSTFISNRTTDPRTLKSKDAHFTRITTYLEYLKEGRSRRCHTGLCVPCSDRLSRHQRREEERGRRTDVFQLLLAPFATVPVSGLCPDRRSIGLAPRLALRSDILLHLFHRQPLPLISSIDGRYRPRNFGTKSPARRST